MTTLSATELRLIVAAVDGQELDLTTAVDCDIRADVLREALRGNDCHDPDVRSAVGGAALDPRGIRVRGATLRGRLDLRRMSTSSPLVLRECRLPDGLSAEDAQLQELCLVDCVLFAGPSEPALAAAGVRVEHNLTLSGTSAHVDVPAPALDLAGARVGAQLALDNVQVTNSNGPAIDAAGVRVGGRLFLAGLHVDGRGDGGALRLAGAHVDGQLDAVGLRARNASGPALAAGGLRVRENLDLTGAHLSGEGDLGALRLQGGSVEAYLRLDSAKVTNTTGPCIVASSLSVAQDLSLVEAVVEGSGLDPALTLRGAAAGAVTFQRMRVRNDSGPALTASGLRVRRDVLFDGLRAAGSGPTSVVDLHDLQIAGRFSWSQVHVASDTAGGELELDGLQFDGLPIGVSVEDWLKAVATQTRSYAAQPYRLLANAAQAAGDDKRVRRIYVLQRQDQLARTPTTWRSRAWAAVTRLTLGYGYQPWRALVFLLGLVCLSVALSLQLRTGGLVHAVSGGKDTVCSTTSSIAHGIDVALPLVNTGAATTCQPTPTVRGEWLTCTYLAVQALAWAFATLFAAGFTAAVRRV